MSAGEYSNYKQLVERPRARVLRTAIAPYAYAGNADFNYPLVPHDQRAALGIQARLVALRRLAAGPRRATATYGDFQFGRDFGGVFWRPSHNVFLVKLSYWLNM